MNSDEDIIERKVDMELGGGRARGRGGRERWGGTSERGGRGGASRRDRTGIGEGRDGVRSLIGRGRGGRGRGDHGDGEGGFTRRSERGSILMDELDHIGASVRGQRGGGRGGRGDRGVRGQRARGRGGRGDRGGRGAQSVSGARSCYVHRLQLRDLTDMAKCPPQEVVTKLRGDLKGFQESLNSCSKIHDKSRDHYIRTVLALLWKVCQARTEDATAILAEFLSERCAGFHMLLKSYITSLSISADAKGTLHRLYSLFKYLLDALPSSAWIPLPFDDLVTAVNDLPPFLSDITLCDNVLRLKAQRDDTKREQTEKKKNPCNELEWDNTQYRTIPILPTMDEICTDTPPPLRSNIVTGAYSGWEHYYDVQFRLLREDFLAPLRRGVSMFCSQERRGRLTDINVYNDVQLVQPEFTENGICYQVKFDVSRFRQRRTWAHSKRLIFGSLLCFSPQQDRFRETIYFATVIDRKSEELDNGIFHVQFDNGLDMFQHICKTNFTVIESKAYFEASRHILRSLQTAETHTMPFTRYLITNQPTPVDAPRYLEGSTSQYDIRWLYPLKKTPPLCFGIEPRVQSIDSLVPHRVIDITKDYEWPSEGDIELDESQIKAIKMALTQEISVIQGPPGTGKTYIGYKIVQTLLQNREVWDPNNTSPILVMCYTNHALDQFLQGIIQHKICMDGIEEVPNIVRIGGRSKCEEIQKCSLWNARGKFVPSYKLNEVRSQKGDIVRIASAIPWLGLQKLIQNQVNEFIVGEEGMRRLRPVIHPSHFYQLTLLGEEINKVELSLEFWLGFWAMESLTPVPVSVSPTVESFSEVVYLNDEEVPAGDIQTEEEVGPENKDDSVSNVEEMIQITGEAEIEEANRRLDDGSYRCLQLKENAEDIAGEIDDPFITYIARQQSRDKEMKFKYVKKDNREISRILREIRNCEPFETEDERDIADISSLRPVDRYRLVRLWVLKYKQMLGDTSQRLVADFERECRRYKLAQQDIDRIALEKADVIGMTTTGAAKYQHILHLIKPKIVIVEEAAEVLESHIVSALNAGTQHLILIGDHKQLRPKPNEYELAKKHNLEVSLFERLLRNHLPHATLLIQHRMRPQIAGLVCPSIYKTLINHETVKTYKDVKSCDKNMYFFHHTCPEKEDERLMSHSNTGEAEFVVSLCKHLLKQGYSSSQITILTAYTGQLLSVRDQMPRKEFEGVQVVNIDNFQGEENDIIILSLVRNNVLQKVGFLREENRVCVALSRARMGFYCFGNFEMLRSVVPIWEVILSHVSKEGCLGSAFPLHCHNHPDFKVSVCQAREFSSYFPEGGCNKTCMYRLDCGHHCRRTCHVTDADHKEYLCKQPCPKLCANGKHPCKAQCFQECPRCITEVEKKLPVCGHKQVVKCWERPEDVQCLTSCPKLCPNDLHKCPLKCWQDCSPCKYLVKHKMPKCEHEQGMFCYCDPAIKKCYHPCTKLCPDGHSCHKVCSEECGKCIEKVNREMPQCGHVQSMSCFQNPSEFKCRKKCKKIYDTCGHRCPKLCSEVCDIFCQEPVERVLPICSHIDVMPCHKDPNSTKCTRPCERNRACGHACKGQCGELCLLYKCEEPKLLTLPCTHETTVNCNDYLKKSIALRLDREYDCKQHCLKSLPCGHKCKNTCEATCTTQCKAKVEYTCAKGDHAGKIHCYLKKDPPPCEKRCTHTLPCGHLCKKKCREECSDHCGELISRKCPCGHKHNFKCGDTFQNCLCKGKCSKVLQCGHKCPGLCGDCFTKRIHSPCIHQLQVNRFCGHSASLPCVGMLDKCEQPCRSSLCPHRREACEHKCFQSCTTEECGEKCIVECPHVQCSRTCSQICDVPSCKEPCTKTLKCRHYCSGACGDQCLQYCMSCNAKKFRDNMKGIGKKAMASTSCGIQLDCGHSYTVQYLDNRFKVKPKQDKLIRPLLCPACSKPFTSAHYWKMSREIMEDVKQIKERLVYEADVVDQFNLQIVEFKARNILSQFFSNRKIRVLTEKNDPEGMCAMKLLCSSDNLHEELTRSLPKDHQLLKNVKSLVRVVAKILIETKGKLSTQLISDIESELFRFSLLALKDEVIFTPEAKSYKQLWSILQQMEDDHSFRLTFEVYQDNFQSLNSSMHAAVESHSVPRATKGEWYKCDRAGHIYFVPAKYTFDHPHCTVCK